MKTYRIENVTNGLVLGTYKSATEKSALDAMARAWGYRSYDQLERVPRGARVRGRGVSDGAA